MTDEEIRVAAEKYAQKHSGLNDLKDNRFGRYFRSFTAGANFALSRKNNELEVKVKELELAIEIRESNRKDVYANYLKLEELNRKQHDEIDRLKRIIAKELTEDDELGSEFTYVGVLKEEVSIANQLADANYAKVLELDKERHSLREQLKVAEDLISKCKCTINQGAMWAHDGPCMQGCTCTNSRWIVRPTNCTCKFQGDHGCSVHVRV